MPKQKRMNGFLVVLPLLMGNVVHASRNDESNADRMNIIVFIVDDLGWQDTSVPMHVSRTPFNDRYRTPNMQRLAEQGLERGHNPSTAVA